MSEAVERLRLAALAVCDRWDSPDWKDHRHTWDFIQELRAAAALTNPPEGEPVAWLGTTVDGWSDVTLNADNIAAWRGYGRQVQPLYTRPVAWPDREAVARAIADGFSNGCEPYAEATETQRLRYDMAADTILALLSASDGAGQVEEKGE